MKKSLKKLLVIVLIVAFVVSFMGTSAMAVGGPAIPQKTLTVSVVGQGSVASVGPGFSVDVVGTSAHDIGTVLKLRATPADLAWEFDHWEGDLTGSTNPNWLNMWADRSVTAVFTPVPTYNLSLGIVGDGYFLTPGVVEGDYLAGTEVALIKSVPLPTGIPLSLLIGWRKEGTSTLLDKYVKITMSEDCKYYAVFGEKLKTTAGDHGSLTTDYTGNYYEKGTHLNLTALTQPTGDTGWEFDCWEEKNWGVWEKVDENITIGDSNVFRACFKQKEYTIDTTVTGGTITPDQTVTHGSDSTINYSPNTNYHLASVTVDGADMTATNPSSYTFTGVTADHTIDVVYEIDTFTIDTTAGANGTITPDQTVGYGSDSTISYSADTGYHLASLTVDGNPVDIGTYPSSYTFTGVTTDHTISATFAINMYTIDTTVTGGTITPDQSVAYGSDSTINYSPNANYHLASVTVDGADVTATNPSSYTFTGVTADHTIDVVYEIDTFTIDTTAGANGTITPDQTVGYGSDSTISYSADAGYHLASLTVDGNPIDIGTYPSSYTFTGVTADHTISVTFAINMYTIDTTVTGGTITPDQSVAYGSDSTISYSANTGYHLVSVTVDGTDMTATNPSSYTFSNVQADHTIEVVYEIDTFTIDTTAGANGTITPDQTVGYGNDSTINYSADAGYHLASLTVDGNPIDIGTYPSSYTFTGVTADHTISATFAINMYTIDTTASANGTITPDQTVGYGSDSIISYSADTGYHLASLTVDGNPVDIGTYPSSYTFTGVTADHTIEAVFEINVYTVSFVDQNGDAFSVAQPINHGSDAVKPLLDDPVGTRYDAADTAWEAQLLSVTEDREITVTLEYLVTFDINGGSLNSGDLSQWVAWGEDAVEPDVDAPSGEHFADPAWNTPFTGITAPTATEAQYEGNYYTVTFLDEDGNVIGTDRVRHGQGAEAPEAPEKEGHTFDGWSDSIDPITGRLTVTAVYKINTYTVTFVDDDGETVLGTDTVEWMKAASAPDVSDTDEKIFVGWDTSFDEVTDNLTVMAMYEQIVTETDEEVPETNVLDDAAEIPDEDTAQSGTGDIVGDRVFPWWWILVGVGGAAILFLLLFFWKRRKKDEEEA